MHASTNHSLLCVIFKSTYYARTMLDFMYTYYTHFNSGISAALTGYLGWEAFFSSLGQLLGALSLVHNMTLVRASRRERHEHRERRFVNYPASVSAG